MKIIRKKVLRGICGISSLIAATSYANIFDIFDTPEALELLSEDSIEDVLQHHRKVDPETIIQQLVDAGIIDLLKRDLYCHTNQFNQRSLLDLPVFELMRTMYESKWVTGFSLFWNQMNDSYYTQDSAHLSSYINLSLDDSFINKIQNFVEPLIDSFSPDQFNINIARVIQNIGNLRVHQRRIGAMIHGRRQWDKWRLRFLFPFYYLEHNFFLNNQEREALAEEFGSEAEEEFQDKHFVSDKLGFGDTRLEIEHRVYGSKRAILYAGIQLTLPTAFALKKGLKGSSFSDFKNACLPQPTLIEDIFCDILGPNEPDIQKAFDQLTVFALGALDRVSANLIDTSLGNDHHVGFGALLHIYSDLNKTVKRPWTENITVCHRLSLEYLFPADEKRFYIEKNNIADFDEHNFNDDEQAQVNLAFLERELVKRFYMAAVDTTIQPGIIWRWLSKLCYEGHKFGANFGFDFWLQTDNKIISLDTPCFGDMTLHLDTERAKIGYAYQGKFFGDINGKIEQATRTWFVGGHVDYTFFSTGIGHDWTVALNIEAKF